MKMQEGAERFGVETKFAEVLEVDLVPEIKIIRTSGGEFHGKTVVIAMGAGHKTLGVEHEAELAGRGVAYCATCDGMFYRGKNVAIVGGGNTAVADALHLANIVDKVTLIHRRDTLKATKIYHDPLMQAENIDIMWDSQVEEFVFDQKLSAVKVKNLKTGEITELPVEGLFVSVGRTPATKLFEGQLELDEQGYIVADESTRTSIPGVFAVGDIRTKALRQVITAASDGAVATHYAEEYLMK
jgi:thioredoxin reductase (NADPH)